ncbi:S-4TM family putative pore-forming effector [Microbispora rosea]|uniref:S-4TM family putative pore-forming effector n=1 Tax=Microbispora rosea TaxID=58117 RepID=UPI00343B5CC5
MTGLAARQNSKRSIDLHRAIAVAHSRAQRAHTAALLVSVAVATLSVIARIVPATAPTVAVIGAVWTGTYTVVVVPWAARYQRTSANLQEILDTELFDLPWNHVMVGEKLTDDQVSEFKYRFRGDEQRLRDYYLVANVRQPYEVLFCLEQNLGWGSRVRQRYAQLLLTISVLWCSTGVVVGLVADLRIPDLVSTWFVPSLGLLLLCLDNYRAQLSNTRERSRVREMVVNAFEESARPPLTVGPEWTAFARQVQDLLFQMRRQQPRVPTWFFRRYHDRDKRDFEYRMSLFEARINSTAQP